MPAHIHKNKPAVGVDGCKAGWFVVEIERKGDWTIDIFQDIGAIWQRVSKTASLILIDIPIGLPRKGTRACDVLARTVLKKRASSVFPVPCRKALQASKYEDASKINYQESGKKLSVQSWNISSKIKEVDALLTADFKARHHIRESHPEVCFWALSGGRPMRFNKKTADGHRKRKHILQRLYPRSKEIIESAMSKFLRKDLAKDDILDALVLAVTALSPPETIVTFPQNPPYDDQQLPMEIVYTNCQKNEY
jgi:predicted RNase H-like nuclease